MIPLVLGFHRLLDLMDFWTSWIFGLDGLLDFTDFFISKIFGFHGFLDFIEFYWKLRTVFVQGSSQENDNIRDIENIHNCSVESLAPKV